MHLGVGFEHTSGMDVVGAVKGRQIFVTGGIGFIGEAQPSTLAVIVSTQLASTSEMGIRHFDIECPHARSHTMICSQPLPVAPALSSLDCHR